MLFTDETDAGLFKIALEETNMRFAVNRMFSLDRPEEVQAKFTVELEPALALQHGWELARMVNFIKLKVTNDDAFYTDRLKEYTNDFEALFTPLEKELH